jgi:hypothetical protein
MISLALLLSCRADIGLNLFDRPLLFAYGSWEKKATVVDGRLELRGVTPQGGGGTNLHPVRLVDEVRSERAASELFLGSG